MARRFLKFWSVHQSGRSTKINDTIYFCLLHRRKQLPRALPAHEPKLSLPLQAIMEDWLMECLYHHKPTIRRLSRPNHHFDPYSIKLLMLTICCKLPSCLSTNQYLLPTVLFIPQHPFSNLIMPISNYCEASPKMQYEQSVHTVFPPHICYIFIIYVKPSFSFK